MDIQLTTRIFKEGRSYVAHALEPALKNLKVAGNLFLEEADHMGTLERILREAPI